MKTIHCQKNKDVYTVFFEEGDVATITGLLEIKLNGVSLKADTSPHNTVLLSVIEYSRILEEQLELVNEVLWKR